MKTSSSNTAVTPLEKGYVLDQTNTDQINTGQLNNGGSLEQSSPIQQLSSSKEENVSPQKMNHVHDAHHLAVQNLVNSEKS